MLILRQTYGCLVKLEVVSTDHGVLVYKVDNPIQSSLLSSLVFNPNTRFFYLTYFKVL